jgi:hypothetical protein
MVDVGCMMLDVCPFMISLRREEANTIGTIDHNRKAQ